MDKEKSVNNINKLNEQITKLESNINLSYYSPEKFDFITKSKEMNCFKEEILSYLRERDSFFMEKINNIKFNSDINSKKIEQISETLDNNYNSILSKQVELSTKFEKLKSYDTFMNKANDKLISLEIKINNIKEDMAKNFLKYDKIYLENLIVPGYIGKGAKYTNCKLFILDVIKNLDKLNTFKEKNVLDLDSYKEKLESIIKTFQIIVDNYNNSQIKYITKLNGQTNKNILDIMDEKLKNLRIENSYFSTDLMKKSNELNEIYDKVKLIKKNIIEEFNNALQEYNKKIEEANKSFDEYKIKQNKINKKLMNFVSLLKFIKFPKDFEFQLNNEIKNQKNNTRNNNNDIELRNFFDIKNNNFANKRLSKSQNNFNSGNYVINLRKDIKITSNPKKTELKNQRNSIDSLLNYSRTSSVNSLEKVNNILKFNINIKRQKGITHGIPMINSSNSQRNAQTALNIINNIKKDKEKEKEKITSYEEKTNMRTNAKEDDASFSGSVFSNLNNSINTFTTTNEYNNTINNTNINLKAKTEAFNLIEKEKEKNSLKENNDNDKVIKEIASELEQSTNKKNMLCSNKKEIEKNFKSICDKIQPINLKLNNSKTLEQIEEFVEKNNSNLNTFSNKSEQISTLFTNNNNLNNININNFNFDENKLKEFLEKKDNIEETTYIKNREKEKENINQRMNLYDTKLLNLESFTKDKYYELIKQINHLQKNYAILTNFIKKDRKNKNLNLTKISGYKTINSMTNSINLKKGNIEDNISLTNNENKNILNLTSNYFNKRPQNIEVSSKFSSMSKNIIAKDDSNLSQNILHNGKYFSNIKDIFGQKKFENKKLLNQKSYNKDKENKTLNNKIND